MTRRATSNAVPTVAGNLRAARADRALTQRQVAEAIGVTPADVSRWESGRVEPGSKYRYALADFFFDGDISALYRPLDQKAKAA
jgi:transcriptional regulator with XRE-family HTH domain